MPKPLLVFVHGWSVTSTGTYGGLPARLKAEAAREGGPGIDVAHVHLGQYVSFRNEVRIDDIARAFEAALGPVLAEAGRGRRFACITHSTGGPVVREWLDRHYVRTGRLDDCPMSHLVMLAPANFGSALAQLGKSRLAGIKAWFAGVEPGQGVLDWLGIPYTHSGVRASALAMDKSAAKAVFVLHRPALGVDHPALRVPRATPALLDAVLASGSITRESHASLLSAHASLLDAGMRCTLDRRPRRVPPDAPIEAARTVIRDAVSAQGLRFEP